MVVLFVLFAIFSVSVPVILEARRTGGDNILRQAGIELLETDSVRQLQRMIRAVPATLRTVAASVVVLAIVALLLWLLVAGILFIF